jgi:hypothetical protein
MKFFLIISLLVSGFANAQDLDSYLWKNRVIVLFKDDNNSKWKNQQDLLKDYSEELIERDIVVLEPEGKTKSKWLAMYDLESNFNGLVLIGKDGGLKLKEKFLVQPQTIFALVDTMPMRRGEIKRMKKNPN